MKFELDRHQGIKMEGTTTIAFIPPQITPPADNGHDGRVRASIVVIIPDQPTPVTSAWRLDNTPYITKYK
jgi:hypothetical protein